MVLLQRPKRRLHLSLLVEVGGGEPAVQRQRRAAGLEHLARFREVSGAGHAARPQPLDQGGEVPGVDEEPVDRGLPAHGVEPGAVPQRRQQGVAVAGLVKPGDGGGGARQGTEQRGAGGVEGGRGHNEGRPFRRLGTSCYRNLAFLYIKPNISQDSPALPLVAPGNSVR
jgi:hypothetical protein